MKKLAVALLAATFLATPVSAKKSADDIFDPCVLDLGFAEVWICFFRAR